MRLPHFDYAAPTTVAEALRLLAEKGPGARVLAGGTDLIIRMRHGLIKPSAIIHLGGIAELRAIAYKPKTGLSIGAAATLAEVAAHPDIRRRYPAVAYAAGETANVQVRNLGTVGGNLCNAAPSADNAPTLMALGAEMVLAGLKGERRVRPRSIFQGTGPDRARTRRNPDRHPSAAPAAPFGRLLSAGLGPGQGGYLRRLRGRGGRL